MLRLPDVSQWDVLPRNRTLAGLGMMGQVSIHSDHPFMPVDADRSPIRQLRGRLGAGVSIWASGEGRDRVGLTVSSMLVADGEPGNVLGLLDPDSDLWEHLQTSRTFTVNLLGWDDRHLADAFAGAAPAPGGVFRLGTWTDSEWGPVLDSALAWAGCRLLDREPRTVGYTVTAEATVQKVFLAEEADRQALMHRRGRYHPL